MKTFLDYYGNKVNLRFACTEIENNAAHVLSFCKIVDDWLLTKHSQRGLEFPGGHVESGETPREAAIREVYEETGGVVDELTYIGQYIVHSEEVIVKNIYFAQIGEMERKEEYLETEGPQVIQTLPKNIHQSTEYSFIMKDNMLMYALQEIKRLGLN